MSFPENEIEMAEFLNELNELAEQRRREEARNSVLFLPIIRFAVRYFSWVIKWFFYIFITLLIHTVLVTWFLSWFISNNREIGSHLDRQKINYDVNGGEKTQEYG